MRIRENKGQRGIELWQGTTFADRGTQGRDGQNFDFDVGDCRTAEADEFYNDYHQG
jgi:hypothetical protein